MASFRPPIDLRTITANGQDIQLSTKPEGLSKILFSFRGTSQSDGELKLSLAGVNGMRCIAEDIEELRRTSMEWACSPGTACTGLAIDADKPVAYQTATTNPGAYKTACSSSTLAALMQQQLPTALPSGSTQLDWGHNRPKGIVIPAALTTLTINRSISANGNQLEVSYETGPSAPFKVELHSSLVPEALGWCA